MSNLTEHIGGRIRLYRKHANTTIDELSKIINKSKSTLSKYERGSIIVDIETLFDLAKALNISVHQLIDYYPPESSTSVKSMDRKRILDRAHYYLYYYDGREKRITRGYIEVKDNPLQNDNMAILYMDIESFSQFSKCRYLYNGKYSIFDSLSRFTLVNQSNCVEYVVITLLDSMSFEDIIIGNFNGISIRPFMPVSFKCVLSSKKLDEDEKLIDLLRLDNETLKMIKKSNMFTPIY